MPLRPDFTFDRFVTTLESRQAIAACRELVRSPTRRVLVLCGPPGTGKTHLLQAVGHAIANDGPGEGVIYESAGTFCSELVMAIRAGGSSSAILARYAPFSAILFDDLQDLAGKKETQHEVSSLLDACIRAGKRVACATTRWPIDANGSDVWGEAGVVRLAPPRPGSMRRILRASPLTACVQPSERALHVFAEESGGDVRRGLGALARWRLTRHSLSS